MALYLAKGDGRGTHRFFEREMDKRLQSRRALELDLRKAIANGEFELYYQPILYLQTGKVSGFEALVRWNHPERGMISPVGFHSAGRGNRPDPAARRMGAAHRLRAGRAAGRSRSASRSTCRPMQFKGRNLVQLTLERAGRVRAAAGAARARDHRVGAAAGRDPHARACCTSCASIGVRISMDDFGTGYSSLAYLRNFPFDKIKIDRSFVRDMLVRKDCQAIIRAVVGLARSLGITTIIEGIETKEQLDVRQGRRLRRRAGLPVRQADARARGRRVPRQMRARRRRGLSGLFHPSLTPTAGLPRWAAC